ncbi:hypothetical protein N7509_001732 [Penicillium cosmopolitanum]|uniref:Uncharacterized protein n=1 Tax=Penicillium cosmopolitanum TaxID=1131564 RepID=A0A9X0BCT4_9EURO|nr:uncharacterized protein N7509_001732 [Penicillium cosmopolitanum]KAJ5407849.1 hypothetical protein N7509_001732 [Penicillium cosmopolitanum]
MKFIFTLVSVLVLLAMMAEGRSLYQGSPAAVHDEQSLNDLAKDNSGTILYANNVARATVTEGLTRYHTAPPSDAVIFHDEQSLSDLIKVNPDTLLHPENGGYYLKNMEEAVIGVAADGLCDYLGASFAFFNDDAGANVMEEPECLHEKVLRAVVLSLSQTAVSVPTALVLGIASTEVVLHALTRSFVLSRL